MSLNEYKKWLAFGTGVGIEIGARDLMVTLARVRPSGARITGSMTIERYAERPAGEWGTEYSRFLAAQGASHLAATILLPRRDVIVRQIAMPGVGDKDLEQAVRFQIDGLHPYNEDETVYDFARIGSSTNILVGITRRAVVDRYAALFAEAGIKIASLTFSAAVLYGALRMFGTEPAGAFLALDDQEGELEAYGESPARPVFSAAFDTPSPQFAARAVNGALSELRLPADTEPQTFEAIVPAPLTRPEGYNLGTAAMTYAAALASACPRLFPQGNLLPPEQRVTSSRAMYIPTIALGVLLLLSMGGLVLYGAWEDRKFADALHEEIRRLEPAARRPMAIDREITIARQRSQMLDNFRKRTQADLDALNEVTHLLPPPGWVLSMELTRDQMRISGEAEQAAGLLRVLDKSPLFEASDFALPMARTATGESFSIRARREGMLP